MIEGLIVGLVCLIAWLILSEGKSFFRATFALPGIVLAARVGIGALWVRDGADPEVLGELVFLGYPYYGAALGVGFVVDVLWTAARKYKGKGGSGGGGGTQTVTVNLGGPFGTTAKEE